MTGKVFVDSNILIHAHDVDAGSKQERAATWLRDLWELRTGWLSTQVLQEFYVNVTLKIKKPLRKFAAREVVRNYARLGHGQAIAGVRIVNPFLQPVSRR